MNQDLTNKDFYTCSDLSLVALISLYYPIDVIDRTNPRKAVFFFKRSDQLDSLIEAYWRKELQVEPQSYFSQLKTVKARLYEND